MATSKDIARALNVTEQTVRQYARDGEIPFTLTPGGHRRYDLDDVLLALSLRNEAHEFAPLEFGDDAVLLDESPTTPFAAHPAERFSEVAFGDEAFGDDAFGDDAEQLETLLDTLQQGDVLDVPKGVTLFSPDVPTHPNEVSGIEHLDPVMVQEFALPAGLCMVVSQDCDLRRDPLTEPYLLIAPMLEVDAERHGRARLGLTPRYFGFPPFDTSNGDHRELLVADLRLVQSIEKLALLSPHVHRTPCPLSQPRRDDLRRWLGRRLGRVPFPDDVQRHVVDKVNEVIKRAAKREPTSRAVQCIAFVGLRWTPGKPNCELLVLTDRHARELHKVREDEVRALKNKLDSGLARTGDYVLSSTLRDTVNTSAAQVFEFHEIGLEIA